MVGPPSREQSAGRVRLSTRPVQERLAPAPPEAWPALVRLAQIAGRPLERFLHIEASSGILLLVVATVALTLANSPWRESYYSLWHTPIGILAASGGAAVISLTLGRLLLSPVEVPGIARTADEAECSTEL
jgi:hypothetical protein